MMIILLVIMMIINIIVVLIFFALVLEELMQYIGSTSQLHSLRSRARDYLHMFQHPNRVCTLPAVQITSPFVGRSTGFHGS